MLTKTANALLANMGRVAAREATNPLNLGLTAYFASSGNSSLGEAAGMTAGGVAGAKMYNAASKKYILPKLESLVGKLPGAYGRAAKGAVGVANAVTGFIAPAIAAGKAGNFMRKNAPVYARTPVM